MCAKHSIGMFNEFPLAKWPSHDTSAIIDRTSEQSSPVERTAAVPSPPIPPGVRHPALSSWVGTSVGTAPSLRGVLREHDGAIPTGTMIRSTWSPPRAIESSSLVIEVAAQSASKRCACRRATGRRLGRTPSCPSLSRPHPICLWLSSPTRTHRHAPGAYRHPCTYPCPHYSFQTESVRTSREGERRGQQVVRRRRCAGRLHPLLSSPPPSATGADRRRHRLYRLSTDT